MQLFRNKTAVKSFTHAAEFAEEFKIGPSDFILASRRMYEKYFAPLNLTAHVEFKSKYGAGEPTDLMIDALIADFRASGCKRIIAIGGGAVIDMAKVLVLKDAAKTEDIFLRRVPIIKEHELIAVPTTCGAGSEVSSVSITALTERGSKLGLADEAIFPDAAVLIPELLSEMPYEVFATSAIDALIHAVESFVSPKANRYTEIFSEEAARLIISGFRRVLAEGEETRMALLGDFLMASDMAGIAFANAGTGAVHAMSYPLSGKYHVTHGEANYQFFTAVFREYHRQNPTGKLLRMEALMADILGCGADVVYEELEKLLDNIISRKKLHEYGMTEEETVSFAADVIELQQRLLNQSYVKFDQETMTKIYRELL